MTDIDEFFQEIEKKKIEKAENFYWIGSFKRYQDFFGSRESRENHNPGGLIYFRDRDTFFLIEGKEYVGDKEGYKGKFYHRKD